MTATGNDDAADTLHVKAVRHGGFTGVPVTYEMDTASLAPGPARTLRDLVRAAGLFENPGIAERRFPQGRDLIEWEITATCGGSSRSLRCSEDALRPALAELIAFVRRSG
jgi:hypothetical protein